MEHGTHTWGLCDPRMRAGWLSLSRVGLGGMSADRGALCVRVCVSSDALVKVNVGGETLGTVVAASTRAPVWNESFTFPVRSKDTPFTLTVEHKSRILLNTFLGKHTATAMDFAGARPDTVRALCVCAMLCPPASLMSIPRACAVAATGRQGRQCGRLQG